MFVMKMCGEFPLLPEETSETSNCAEGGEIKTAIDVKATRGLSIDLKKPNIIHHNDEGSSVCREEKRTNSDDESEAKIGGDRRDESVSVATRGLDTLAAMAEAQSIERERRVMLETDLVARITQSASKSSSDADSEKDGHKSDNCDVLPQNKQVTLRNQRPQADPAPSDISRHTPSTRELSPPYERYPPPPPPSHFMHAPPHPGYCAHPHPYYPYSHVYMPPTPPRLHSSSPYSHYPRQYYRHPHAYGHSHRHYHRYDAHDYQYLQQADTHSASVLPSIEAIEADQVYSSSCKRTRRPSMEGLPIKKRKFQETRPDETSPLSIDFSESNIDGGDAASCATKEADSSAVKNEETNSDAENSRGPEDMHNIPSEAAEKRMRSISDMVTPSPRGIDPKRVHSSSASIHSAGDDKDCAPVAATSSESGVFVSKVGSSDAGALKPCVSYSDNKCDDKCNIPGQKDTSPPRIVHPRAIPPNHYRTGYPPVTHHPREAPHYPSPPKTSSSTSSKHQLSGFVSPPHHYPYPRHPGTTHPYHYPHYYPPPSQPPHDAAPYWHRHPYYPPPHGHGAADGSASRKGPPEVVSSAVMDGKVTLSPKKRNSPPSKKADVCVISHRDMKNQSKAAGSESKVEDVAVPGAQNSGRKRVTPEGDSALLPSFYKLVNFPEYLPQKSCMLDTLSDDEAKQKVNPATKRCVMCGTCCFYVGTSASKPNDRVEQASASVSSPFIIPRQNKGLCTACDVKVWLVRDLNLTIKWCKGCKNFRLWSAFGDKSRATKCLKCRDRQKEKYAAQKVALKKNRATGKETMAHSERGSDSDDSSEDPNTRESKASDDEMDAALGLSSMMNSHTCR